MNDIKPFKHGEEGTHYACPEMLEKYGDRVKCCACNKHMCKDKKKEDWKEVFDREFPRHDTSHCTGHLYPTFDEPPNRLSVISFISKLLSQQKQELIDSFEKEVKEVKELGGDRFSVMLEGKGDKSKAIETMKSWNTIFNQAISEVLSKLEKLREGSISTPPSD